MPLHPQAQAVVDDMGSRRQIDPTMSPQTVRELMDAQLMALRAAAPEVGKGRGPAHRWTRRPPAP